MFLGREYTRDIIECCEHIDEFINYSSMQNLSIKDLAENLSRLEVDVLLHVFPNSKIAKAGKLAGIPYRVVLLAVFTTSFLVIIESIYLEDSPLS